MYTKGDLKRIADCGHEDYCRVEDPSICEKDYSTVRWIDDSRHGQFRQLRDGTAYLPHSCSEWVIGGKDEVVALIEDLQAALRTISPVSEFPK